ncbi:hypothetical protein NFI96_004198 [Prochilodus magdalenae]|nr:hypothetical protein NFI96_004198 [Prochilodus magdalenae]
MDLLNRLEDQINFDLGKKAGVARTYNSMGYVKYLLGSHDEALSYFEKSVEITKECHGEHCEKLLIVSYGNLAWLHYHKKDYEECESYLTKLKDMSEKSPPSSASVPQTEVLGEKGWTFLKFSRKYYERAKECFRKALELEPEEGEWNAGYAIALYRTETEFSGPLDSPTINQLRRAIETNPDDDVLKVLLALRLTVHKKYNEAENLVEKALENSPEHPHVIRYVGKFFRNQGSVDRAIGLLKRALERVPNSSFIHHQLALSYKKKKISLHYTGSHHSKSAEIQQLRKQCIHHLEMATRLRPSFILAMSELALQYGENRDLSKAEELFQATFQVAKEKNDACQLVNVCYALFQEHSMRCEPLAIKHHMQCMKMGPDTTEGNRSACNLKRIAEKRISRNPKDGEAFGILGFIHKEKGEKSQAIECYEKALSYEDNEEMTQVTLLETDLQKLECHFTWELKKEDTNITDLLNRLEENIEFNRGGKAGVAQTYNTLAFVKYLLGSPAEALSNLQKSAQLTKEFRESNIDKWLIVTYGNLAWLQYHMKCYAECESYLEKLREMAGKFPTESSSALCHEVLGEKAWALFKFSRDYYERAKECFRKALELEPREPQWNAGYAFVLHRTEYGSCSSADDSPTVKQLQKAIDTDSDNNELKALLALWLAKFKEYDEAESLVEKALEGSPNAPKVIRYVGKFLRSYGSVDRSIALLKRALEHSPNSAFIHHQLALCYKNKKMSLLRKQSRDSPSDGTEIKRLCRQCIYHLEKATTLKACFIIAMVELGIQYGEDDKLDDAENRFQETLRIAKEKNEFQQRVYFHYGEFQQYRKRFLPLAIEYYKECVKIDHDSKDGRRSVKNLTKIADRSLAKNPQDERAWGILGFIHEKKGEKSRAIECYEKALQFRSNDEYLSALCELRLSLMTQVTLLETDLQKLECHFTWGLKKEDTNITDLLNRLEENIEFSLGGKAGVAQTYNTLAFVKYLLGSPTEALSNLQKSAQLTKEFRESNCDKWLIVTYGNLAWLQYHMKCYAECESYLEKLREIAEKFPTESSTALCHEVIGEKAWALFKFSRDYYERAKECFRKALELEPQEGEWNAGYAIALYRTETQLPRLADSPTIKQLRRAIETKPDDDVVKVLLGLKLADYKKYDEAKSLVEKAFENSPEHPHVIRYLGKFYRKEGSVDRAIALFKKALEKVPSSALIHHQLALCYNSKKTRLYQTRSHHSKTADIQRLRNLCIFHLEMATTSKSSFIFAMNELALQYGEKGDFSKAEETFQATFQAVEEKQYGSQAVHFCYAQFQQHSRKCEFQAIVHYKECLKMGAKTNDGKRSAGSLKGIAERRISRHPKDGKAFGILGFIHKEKGEKYKAIECYEKALSYEENEDMAQASLLETELQQLECHFTWELKKEDINITDLLNRLEQHEEFSLGGKAGVAQTYNTLAFVKYLLGSPAEALDYLQKSMELTKEYRESNCDKWLIVTYGNLAWLQYHMKCYAECESYLEKLREIAEKFPTESSSALCHEVLGEKAWALFKFSRDYYERAKECFRKALELEPREPQWNAGYAFVLHRTEYGSCSSADDSPTVKQLQKAIDTDSDNNELKALLALWLAKFKEYDEAESLVEKALEGSPNAPNVIRYVGKFLRSYGSVDRSIALLKRALEHSPNSAFIHHQLALCYKNKKMSLLRKQSRDSPSDGTEIKRLCRQCIYHLEKATTLKACFIIAMVELSVQYGENDKLDDAENQFQETLRIAKEKNELQQRVYFHYGEFQQYRKRFLPLAIEYYKECVKIDHDSKDGKRSVKNLTKIADRSLAKNPQDERAWGILGFIHEKKGEKSRAIECYEKALQFRSNDEYLSALCELRLSL